MVNDNPVAPPKILLDPAGLQGLLQSLAQPLPESNCNCSSCFAALDEFVERLLGGEDVATIMPLIHCHLTHCRDCWQEYEALIAILESFNAPPPLLRSPE